MANIEKIKRSAAPFVDEGERVQAAFFGQSISPWWTFAPVTLCIGVFTALHADLLLMAAVAGVSTIPITLITKYRNVIVTDRRMLVLAGSPWRVEKISSVVRELPRTTLIGPAIGTYYETQAIGERLFIPKGYAEQISIADQFNSQDRAARPGTPRATDGGAPSPGSAPGAIVAV